MPSWVESPRPAALHGDRPAGCKYANCLSPKLPSASAPLPCALITKKPQAVRKRCEDAGPHSQARPVTHFLTAYRTSHIQCLRRVRVCDEAQGGLLKDLMKSAGPSLNFGNRLQLNEARGLVGLNVGAMRTVPAASSAIAPSVLTGSCPAQPAALDCSP